MNIKNEEAHALARRLASLTGESVTAAVTTALRERLDRVTAGTREDEVQQRKERILELARVIRDESGPQPWINHGELLYGPDGLPR